MELELEVVSYDAGSVMAKGGGLVGPCRARKEGKCPDRGEVFPRCARCDLLFEDFTRLQELLDLSVRRYPFRLFDWAMRAFGIGDVVLGTDLVGHVAECMQRPREVYVNREVLTRDGSRMNLIADGSRPTEEMIRLAVERK
jgi:hypothetical protein